jgi:hypothetical protein
MDSKTPKNAIYNTNHPVGVVTLLIPVMNAIELEAMATLTFNCEKCALSIAKFLWITSWKVNTSAEAIEIKKISIDAYEKRKYWDRIRVLVMTTAIPEIKVYLLNFQ